MANSGRDPRNLLSRIHSRETRQVEEHTYDPSFRQNIEIAVTSPPDSNKDLFLGYSHPLKAREVWRAYLPEFVNQGADKDFLNGLLEEVNLISNIDDLDFYLNRALQSYEQGNNFRNPLVAKKSTSTIDDWPVKIDPKNAVDLLGVPGSIIHPLFIRELDGAYSLND